MTIKFASLLVPAVAAAALLTGCAADAPQSPTAAAVNKVTGSHETVATAGTGWGLGAGDSLGREMIFGPHAFRTESTDNVATPSPRNSARPHNVTADVSAGDHLAD
jgi:hypothetical protein